MSVLCSGKKYPIATIIIYTNKIILRIPPKIPPINLNKYFNGFAVSFELYAITASYYLLNLVAYYYN